MNILVSSKHCDKCNKDFKLKELVVKSTSPKVIKREYSVTTKQRIFHACPICGEEIPNIIVPEEEAWKYD